jgi:hypothetical protein
VKLNILVGATSVLLFTSTTAPVQCDDTGKTPLSAVQPRRFGFPGGIGVTRGWYIWRSFDPDKWTAQVSHEATGEKFKVRVLPWATTYRYLVYGAHPDELLAGERVNLPRVKALIGEKVVRVRAK